MPATEAAAVVAGPGASLEAVGLSPAEERAYRCALEEASVSLADLATAVKISVTRARRLATALEAKGLLARSAERPPRYIAAPPGAAFELLILQRQEELQRARSVIAGLVQVSRRRSPGTAPDELVEVVHGREAIVQRFRRLQRSATREIVVFDKAPYAHSPTNPEELEVLARGVRCRGIYEREVLERPGSLEVMRELVEAGEEARVLDSLPMKMAIADRREGLVPLNLGEPGVEGAIAIHASPLLEALTMFFETQWERASPIPLIGQQSTTTEPGRRAGDTDALLVLMAAGLKDEAIARQLGISTRTLDRRLQEMMAELGTRTRFQTAMAAIERGWLRPGGRGNHETAPPRHG